jgi:nitroreductase
MEFKDVLAARHSVRRFDGRPVDRALIDGIISEAGLAPSSKNSRSSGFVVVDDPELLDALSQMREYGSAFLKGAPAAIVVTGDSSKTDLWVDNAAISATYIMLSATARGLGSCWVHVNGRTRNRHDADNGYAEDYVRGLLGLEDPVRVLCVVALGYGA